jgi:hypothetical protein
MPNLNKGLLHNSILDIVKLGLLLHLYNAFTKHSLQIANKRVKTTLFEVALCYGLKHIE